MPALSPQQIRLAALARAARAAVVLPALFALGLFALKRPAAAGFSVFSIFAHLVMVTYDRTGAARFVQAAMLTVLGAVSITLGTLASPETWLAVATTVAVGILSEHRTLTNSRLEELRPALLLAFLLAIAIPALPKVLEDYLLGWTLAGVAAQPALLIFWISLQQFPRTDPRNGGATSATAHEKAQSPWFGNGLGTGVALGLAILLTRLLKLEHAFWVVLGVLPVLHAKANAAARIFWLLLAGTLAGFAMAAVLVAIIGSNPSAYWLALPVTAFAAAYTASAVKFPAGQAGFTVFAVVLFCILLPHAQDVGLTRVEDIALGGAVIPLSRCSAALRRGI